MGFRSSRGPARVPFGAAGGRCYTSVRRGHRPRHHPGGTAIADVLRHAWNRLIRKQWLIFYPLVLAVINGLGFFAVYAAAGGAFHWTAFFTANFDRQQYVRDHFFAQFSFTPTLAVAVFSGLAVCAFTAMIRAPLFRAIAGPRYPLAPRKWGEAGRLMLFYLLWYLIWWVIPLAVPLNGAVAQLVAIVVQVLAILVVFADYVIVFEDLPLLPALRRSLHLLVRRWGTVLVIFVVLQLLYLGLYALYSLYYQGTGEVFILLPISQILVESFIGLFADLVLIFLYEEIRRQSPA
jgi:hypothetical protein